MKIPDHISPIVAYRGWWWPWPGCTVATGMPPNPACLYSFNREEWKPGEAMHAQTNLCSRTQRFNHLAELPVNIHKAPALDCSCGIYATRNKQHFEETGYYDSSQVFGEVYLWGTIVEHTLGWRAEYAYPKFLSLRLGLLRREVGKLEEHLAPLMLFGVPLHIRARGSAMEDIPLWHPEQGFDQGGLAMLADSAADTYRPRPVQQLQVGERIYYGTQMLVVKEISDSDVTVVDGHKALARLKPNQFHWNHSSNRWLADGSLVWIGQEWFSPKREDSLIRAKLV